MNSENTAETVHTNHNAKMREHNKQDCRLPYQTNKIKALRTHGHPRSLHGQNFESLKKFQQ